MESLSMTECENFVKNMMRSSICPKFNCGIYQPFYDANIPVDFNTSVLALFFGIHDRQKILQRLRITAGSAYLILKSSEKQRNKYLSLLFFERKLFKKNGISNSNDIKKMCLEYEKEAIRRFALMHDLKIKTGVTMCSPNLPFICGSADGYVVENDQVKFLVEVKAPRASLRMPIYEWVKKNKNSKIRKVENRNEWKLLKSSRAYYQIQLQLAIANLDMAYALYYSPYGDGSMISIKIFRDFDFIQKNIIILEKLYKQQIIPVLKNFFIE